MMPPSLKDALRRAGITNRELARRLKTTPQNVSNMLRKNDGPQTIGAWARIAEALGVELQVILHAKDGDE